MMPRQARNARHNVGRGSIYNRYISSYENRDEVRIKTCIEIKYSSEDELHKV